MNNYFMSVVICLYNGTGSIDVLCPTVATAWLATALAIKPTTSLGAFWNAQSEESEITASPAPILSSTWVANAGVSTNPSLTS